MKIKYKIRKERGRNRAALTVQCIHEEPDILLNTFMQAVVLPTGIMQYPFSLVEHDADSQHRPSTRVHITTDIGTQHTIYLPYSEDVDSINTLVRDRLHQLAEKHRQELIAAAKSPGIYMSGTIE